MNPCSSSEGAGELRVRAELRAWMVQVNVAGAIALAEGTGRSSQDFGLRR